MEIESKTEALKRLEKLSEILKELPLDKIKQVEKYIHSLGKKALSLREASQAIGVSIDTIRRAIKSGSIKAFQVNRSGNYRIPVDEIERFIHGGKSHD